MTNPLSNSDKPGLIPKYGGYRSLKSYQTAQLVYDGTVVFCNRFVDRRSRTHDQMVQAARSGVQNIAEGSMASATSKKTELKLTGVARASLEELLLDYQAFLRQRGMRLWAKDSPEALAVRNKYKIFPQNLKTPSDGLDSADASKPSELSDSVDPYGILKASAEVAANTLLCLMLTLPHKYNAGRELHPPLPPPPRKAEEGGAQPRESSSS